MTLNRLANSLRQIGVHRRKHFRTIGFDMFISDSVGEHLSFAMPHTNFPNWSEAIGELKTVFASQHRIARLEYFHELFPELRFNLEQTGFEVDMTAPVMTLEATDIAKPTRTALCVPLQNNRDEVIQFLRCQGIAFGGTDDETGGQWLEPMLKGLEDGSVRGMWLDLNSEMVSGAIIQGVQDGELAGVWTAPKHQGKGYAFDLCLELLCQYFVTGQDLCWLSAAEGAQRLYEKLGFRHAGTQLNMRFKTS
jgi:ribosomal protein S18 acetylase RimI-like enzyme